jgi:hypothetical protein
MKEEESTHTHTTNEILLGASVSEGGGARSAPQIEAGARFRHAPQAPNTQTCLPACLLLPIACDYYGLDCFDPLVLFLLLLLL